MTFQSSSFQATVCLSQFSSSRFVVILARVRAARFGARAGGVRDHDRLIRQIGELQGRDQRDIPQQRIVVDRDALERIAQRDQLVQSLLQGVAAPEHAEARLHHLLHQRADLAGLVAALAVADAVEARQRALLRVAVCLAHARSRLDDLGRAQRRRPSENDQVEEAVGAEAVGAMDRDARRLADRHQTRHDGLRSCPWSERRPRP